MDVGLDFLYCILGMISWTYLPLVARSSHHNEMKKGVRHEQKEGCRVVDSYRALMAQTTHLSSSISSYHFPNFVFFHLEQH